MITRASQSTGTQAVCEHIKRQTTHQPPCTHMRKPSAPPPLELDYAPRPSLLRELLQMLWLALLCMAGTGVVAFVASWAIFGLKRVL